MVELLVALAIGSVLIIGAVYVYSQSRRTHTLSDAVARLQENGRFVFSVIEPDIQLAGYYGFSNVPDNIKYIQAGSTAPVGRFYNLHATADKRALTFPTIRDTVPPAVPRFFSLAPVDRVETLPEKQRRTRRNP